MKKSIIFFKALLIIGTVIFQINQVYSQGTTVLKGTVAEYETGSRLPGATVFIAGTNNGTITDINGEYTLTNIPIGKFTVIYSFVSYETDSLEMEFTAGEIKVVDVNLSVVTFGLEEVVITAQLLGQRKAVSQQLNSDAIVNVVSEDKIQELPDVNAAEAIARLPGIALNRSGGEGQKIIIRGMEPKFSAITVNGVRVPSNSATDRSVDLSLISPELLSGIEVYKSPLPDMDAESSAGTVNLKLRKAPDKLNFLVKGLGGYNRLNSDFGDYKGVFQVSNRILGSKLGFLAQSTIERFNRGGDLINYGWAQGSTNPETGITNIEGSSLSFNDTQEKRKRWNSSMNLDYDLNMRHSLTFFGLFSRTNRDRFGSENGYYPNEPGIRFVGQSIENTIDLTTLSFGGDHTVGNVTIDWNLSSSRSEGSTPYDFSTRFNAVTIGGLFDPSLDRTGHPSTYLDASDLEVEEIFFVNADLTESNTLEKTKAAFLNFSVPLQITNKIKGTIKFGGKYSFIDRTREVQGLSERFYYLGTDAVQRASESYDGELIFIPSNPALISIENFEGTNDNTGVYLEDGSYFGFPTVLDQDKLKDWSSIQESNFSDYRFARADNYEVLETVGAGYFMLKLNLGDKLTVIPGFRYEYSNNEYKGLVSFASGTYGQNGEIYDTTTTQQYGEFFPHLHLKFKPFNWFDVRASYAKTIARPDFYFVIPNAAINQSTLNIEAGNPNLSHAISTSYDLSLSFFDRKLGLLTIGGFYKDIENIFLPRSIRLTDPERAEESGWPGYSGYNLTSFTNLPATKVWGYEMEVQTNLASLPKPFNGIVLSINYSRLFSETEVFFLTSETTFEGGFPPIPVTTYTENKRTVSMPTQAPQIFRASIGYDFRGFSARVSGSYQGTKARSYSLNKDFDTFDLKFWRWDASAKQRLGDKWSIFLNLNNISNQQDIRFTRSENYISRIETYGFTGTIGIQFRY